MSLNPGQKYRITADVSTLIDAFYSHLFEGDISIRYPGSAEDDFYDLLMSLGDREGVTIRKVRV